MIDTGADYNHESLAPNMVAGYDFKDNDNDPMDRTSFLNPGHGTHCSGIAGGTGLVNGGISGISPKLSIMPVRILGNDGSGTLANAILGIDYAIAHGADVISASWGSEMSPSDAQPLIEAVKRASDAGVIFVTAAGNGDDTGKGFSNDLRDVYPANANFDNTITVGATDQNDNAVNFSNFGKEKVNIAAPGLSILSTLPNNQYDVLSGTSMSAPLVAGLVSFVKSINKNLGGSEIKALLQATGSPTNLETACNCRIDAAAAIETLMASRTFLVPNAGTLSVGQSLQFAVKNASGVVTFQSSDASVATMDSTGTLTAISSGKVQVTSLDGLGSQAKSQWIYVK